MTKGHCDSSYSHDWSFGMRKIIGYIREHIREDFKPGFYLFVAIFLAISFYINFGISYGSSAYFTFEDKYLNTKVREPLTLLKFLLFYGLPYYLTFFAYTIFYKKTALFKSGAFWLRSLFVLSVLSFNSGFFGHRALIRDSLDPQLACWVDYTAANAGSTLMFLLPLVAFKLIFDRSQRGLYGMTRQNFMPWPYVALVGLMLPLIIWASFQPDFLLTYPTYKADFCGAEEYLGVSAWVTTVIYEVFYIFDFAFVELIFRGFMVIGLAKVLGRGAIMPMVTTYAYLHFGKPMGEALGSIFGGYILGIIAYSSRNIWGGAIVHGGIALCMEFAAIIQLFLLDGKEIIHKAING